jgi:hypothetical protein
MAFAAAGAARRGAFGRIDARHAAMGGAERRFSFENVAILDRLGDCRQGFEQRFRAAVSGADEVVPVRHLAAFLGGVRIGQPLPEAKFAAGDIRPAAAAFGASGRRAFDHVWHETITILSRAMRS